MQGDANNSPPPWTVRDLRRRWKPNKERLSKSGEAEGLRIRIHRCCSWLARVESLEQTMLQPGPATGSNDAPDDVALVCRWIAFNALYARWDSHGRAPWADVESLKSFTSQIVKTDRDGGLAATLIEHKRLLIALLEDEFLSRSFWQDPTPGRAGISKRAAFDARTWYQQKKWAMILERALLRIYVLRCQLVHGGATCGGKLNRTALRRCSMMLGHLLPAMLLAMIDHGEREDWGPLCYPPTGGAA